MKTAVDSQDNQYRILHIPTKEGGKLNAYFRKYTNTCLATNDPKKSLYDILRETKANEKMKAQDEEHDNQSLLGNIALKKFKNPNTDYTPGNIDKDKNKVLDEIPLDRTIYIINFETAFTEVDLKKWFRTTGKIRYVFTGSFSKNYKKERFFIRLPITLLILF